MNEMSELLDIASSQSSKKWQQHLGDAYQGAKADTLETASFLIGMLEKIPTTTDTGKRLATKAKGWLEKQWNEIPEESRNTLAFKIGSFINPADPLAWVPAGKVLKGGSKIAKAAAKGAIKGGIGSYTHSYGEAKLRGAEDEDAHTIGKEAAPYGVGLGGVLGGIAGKLAKGKERKALNLAERDSDVVKHMTEMLPKKLTQKFEGVLHHDPRGKDLGERMMKGHASKKEMKSLRKLSEEAEDILSKQTPTPEGLVDQLLNTYNTRAEDAGNAYIPLWLKYAKVHKNNSFDEMPIPWEVQQALKSKLGKTFLGAVSDKETPTYGDLFFYGKGLESRIKKASKAASSGTEADRIHQNVIGKKQLQKQQALINNALKGMLDDPLLKEGNALFAKDFGSLKNNKIMQNILNTEKGRKHAPKISELFKEETEGLYDFLRSLPEGDVKALYLSGLKIGDNKKIPDFVKKFVSPQSFKELKAAEGLKEVGKFYKETAGKAKPKNGARNQSLTSLTRETASRLGNRYTPFNPKEAGIYGIAKTHSKDPNQMEFLEEQKVSNDPSASQIIDLLNTVKSYKKDRRGNFQNLSEKLSMLYPSEESKDLSSVKTFGVSRLMQEKQLDKTHKPKSVFVKELLQNSPDSAMDILQSLTGNSNIRRAEETLSYLEGLPPSEKKQNFQKMEAIRNLYMTISVNPSQANAAIQEMKKLLKLKNDAAVLALVKNTRLLEKYIELRSKK